MKMVVEIEEIMDDEYTVTCSLNKIFDQMSEIEGLFIAVRNLLIKKDQLISKTFIELHQDPRDRYLIISVHKWGEGNYDSVVSEGRRAFGTWFSIKPYPLVREEDLVPVLNSILERCEDIMVIDERAKGEHSRKYQGAGAYVYFKQKED